MCGRSPAATPSLRWFLLRELLHRKDRRRLVSGLGRQVRDPRMKIKGSSLVANADDDTLNLRIPRNQLGLVGFFQDGYYFRFFGHATEYAAYRPQCQRRVVAERGLERKSLTPKFYDHHKIKQVVSAPAAEPTDPPIAETRAEGNRCAESQVFSFGLHAQTPSRTSTHDSLNWKGKSTPELSGTIQSAGRHGPATCCSLNPKSS